MITVSEASDAYGQVWHAPNAAAISLKDWVQLFEKKTGKKARLTVLPKSVVKIAGLFSPLIKELYELSYQFEYPYLASDEKYIKRFGSIAANHQAIVKNTLQWYLSTKQAADNSIL